MILAPKIRRLLAISSVSVLLITLTDTEKLEGEKLEGD